MGMRLLNRLKDIVTAVLDQRVQEAESQNAGALAQQDIGRLEEALRESSGAVASLGAEVQAQADLEAELRGEVQRWHDVAKIEAEAGHDDTARQALQRKLDAAAELQAVSTGYAALKERFETAKGRVLENAERLQQAKSRVRTAVARDQAEQATAAADRAFGDLGDHEDLFQRIDVMEDHIERRERTNEEARKLADQIAGKDLLRAADQTARTRAVEDELAALKTPPPAAPASSPTA